MELSEKLRNARAQARLTQEEVARRAGISKRALVNYESGAVLPKSRQTYYKLAEVLGVDANILLDSNAEFYVKAAETYGNRAAQQALNLVQQITGLYAGGTLDDEDMDAMMRAIQDAYWLAKEKNRRHVNKRYLTGENE